MKKKTKLITALLLFASASFAQKVITTFYDYKHTEKNEVYSTNSYGVKNGAYIQYSEYGGILVQGTYKNDKSVGKWVSKDDKGKLLSEINYDNNGEYNGQVIRYMGGYKYVQENYKHGQKNGNCKYWYCNGEDDNATAPNFNPTYATIYLKEDGAAQLKYDEYYKNGLVDSIENVYDKQGKLNAQIHFKLGVKEGKYIEYDHDGSGGIMSEGNYQNDAMVGEWRKTFDGQFKEVFTKSDAAYYSINDYGKSSDSTYKTTFYLITGEKRSEGQANVLGYFGLYTRYFKNGQVLEKGKYNTGNYYHKFPNGTYGYTKGSYKDSIWDRFALNGKDSVKSRYTSGQADSTWSVYNK